MRLAPALLLMIACIAPSRTRRELEASVAQRGGSHLARGESSLPPDVVLDDGLSADEARRIAVWRNPALYAELTALETAMADFDEARRPANPRAKFLAPFDPRQLALIFLLPIDAIWQLPFRAEAANRELERVCESLVQLVLDAERDARVAHADAMLAHARVQTRDAIYEAWEQALALAESRARAGDIAPVEAAAVRAETGVAREAQQRARYDATVADARLLFVLGRPWEELPQLVDGVAQVIAIADEAELAQRALAHRPELRAAEVAVHAAGARGKWERSRIASITATIDGQAPAGGGGLNWSLGIDSAELPVFGRNPGGIGRADAAVQRAIHRYAHTRNSVRYDVTSARAALLRARQSAEIFAGIASSIDETKQGMTRAFANGAENYLVVVDALRRVGDIHLRRLDVDAEVLRASAELARAVGGDTYLVQP
jgi:cobalt-zinc-cadmium efflux system outer membrane protein